MPKVALIEYALIEGHIVSIPAQKNTKLQFQIQIKKLNHTNVDARVLMSCYKNCPSLNMGEYWRFHAKLHQARNLANPGSFNYVRWLEARHIQWLGSIKGDLIEHDSEYDIAYPLTQLRLNLAHRLSNLGFEHDVLGIIQALTLGMTDCIDQSHWNLFRRTGITHLMVISGAHIGLIAGLTFSAAKWFWCRLGRVCLYYPAQRAASLVSLVAATVYALLAGLGVPAQRSLIACFFMLLRYFLDRRFSFWQAWRYGLLAVLLFEPHAVLAPGFYLSFLAVAILVLINQRFPEKGMRKILITQLGCLCGLMPLTLFWFSYGSINGLFANLIAIPWVSFMIVPGALVLTLLSIWYPLPWLVTLLSYATKALLYYLQMIEHLSAINLSFSWTNIIFPLALLLTMILILWMPIRQFLLANLLLILTVCFPRYPTIHQGDVVVDVLDVGQGLAVVVRTSSHTLVYDTGMKFYQGSDMGRLAMIPYLQTLGIKILDKVVISHPDLDHRGGLNSLMQRYPVKELLVDDPEFYRQGYSCHQYADWSWDGVKFHFFSIPDLKSKNNSSCVLQIQSLAGNVLLSGDIEKKAEEYLVRTYGTQLASKILVVPHHGSKTSSTLPFLHDVAPQKAIVSYGFDNRYHFPHREIVERYQQKHIALYNTCDCGMVSVKMTDQKTKLECYRSRKYI